MSVFVFHSKEVALPQCLGVSVSKTRVVSNPAPVMMSSMTSPEAVTSATATNKEDAGISTDVEENQQSEGESQKKSSSGGSPMIQRKHKKPPEETKSSIPQPSHSVQRRIEPSTSSACSLRSQSTESNNEHDRSRLAMFHPSKMHVLQPHSHRRHFSHHLRDHFSSPQILRTLESRKDSKKEIVPTLDACDYKDTNFLTEGSPPRTPTYRPHLKTKSPSSSTSVEEPGCRINQALKRKKPAKLLPASLWRESAEKTGQMHWRSSPDSESSCDSIKAANYLRKYKNESVTGPTRPIKEPIKHAYSSNLTSDGKTEQAAGLSKTDSRSWQKRAATKERYSGKMRQNSSTKSFAQGMELKKGVRSSRPAFGSSIPAMTSLRSGAQSRRTCQTCMKRQRHTKSTGTQTETPESSFESSCGSREDFDDVIEKSLANADANLYVIPQSGVDSSESTSYSTEDTSSMTFDDDDVINCASTSHASMSFHESRSDILFRMDEVHAKLQQIKEDAKSGINENHDSESGNKTACDIFSDLYDVATEVSELYDRFDSEENDEHSEFNEMKKQIRQYKRTCRILEYELARANTKPKDAIQGAEREEELAMSQQISTALYWELQNVDVKLKKVTDENDMFRENLALSEIQRTVLQREVLQLRNTVDQMSLHASSVPANENLPLRSHDTIPELQRQLQFQEEEGKAVLKKLIDTDKKKELLEEKLRLYSDHYGEISSPDEIVGKEEWRDNDFRARIRSVEEQCGMLARRIMELEAENEKLAKGKNASSSPESPPHMSLSDVQFLEDEVETLRMTLDEAEQENNSLRCELKQFQEKSSLNEKRFQMYQASQTTLKGLVTPTTSDKIAAWDAVDPGTPATNRTETDFTISGTDNLLSFTAIDACTQTYIDLPKSVSTKSLSERSLSVTEGSPSVTLTKELLEILNRSRETNVENLVSQLANLAVATRQLVDESPSSLHSTGDLHSSMMVEREDRNVCSGFPQQRPKSLREIKKDVPKETRKNITVYFESSLVRRNV